MVRDAYVAIADPTRREILELLNEQGTTPAGEIAVHIGHVSRPAISRHLRILCEGGLADEEDLGADVVFVMFDEAAEVGGVEGEVGGEEAAMAVRAGDLAVGGVRPHLVGGTDLVAAGAAFASAAVVEQGWGQEEDGDYQYRDNDEFAGESYFRHGH